MSTDKYPSIFPRKWRLLFIYPNSASGIIVLLKMPTKIKIKMPPLQKKMRKLTIFVEHGIMAHNP